MKKKMLVITIIILLIQGFLLNFSNKPKVVKDDSIKLIVKEKNIKEIFLEIEKIEELETTSYNKINGKWIGRFNFKGNLEDAKKLISNLEDFKINSYYIRKDEENIYIEGLLEHK